MATKLGPHVIKAAPDLSEYIPAGIAVAKFAGDWGLAQGVPDGVLVIGRLVVNEQDYTAQKQRDLGQTPLEAVQKFLQDQLPTYQSNPHIEYWEGHNEPVWDDEQGMKWYAQFEVERMRLMADLGLKCVLGNFSTGTPKLEFWPAFLPALQVARQYWALLGLHEYSWPWVWWMTGRYQLDPNNDEGDTGWLTLRYRKVYRQYLTPNGLGDVPLVITECGLDPGVDDKLKPPEAKDLTWEKLGNFWRERNDRPDKAEYYFEQLRWYDEELQKDDYVVGATVFTWGNWGGAWKHFDVAGTDVAKKLITYTKANPAQPFAYPGAIGEVPAPRVSFQGADQAFERGRMIWREDKKRIYVLYGDNTWADYEDTFDPATDPISTGLQPPAGLQEPAFGFGKVWREQAGVRDGLGWATEGEQAYPGAIQRFAWGRKLWAREGVYLLRDDETWGTE